MKRIKLISLIVIIVLGVMLVILGIYYLKNNIKEDEPKVLNSNYTIDLIEKQKIDKYYSKDENNIYCDDSVMRWVDYDTFQSLGYGYAKDKKNIYHDCRHSLFSDITYLKNNEKFSELVDEIDIPSFTVLNNVYFKDKNIVMYDRRFGGSGEIKEINGAGPNSFQVIEGQYSRDKDYVYFEFEKSDISDYSSLELNLDNDIYRNYAKDEDGVYYMGQKIVGGDLSTFKSISCQLATGCFAKDKNNIYVGGNILENADVNTFEIMFPNYPEYEEDNRYIWKRGELVNDFEDIDWQDFSLTLEEINNWELFSDENLDLSFRIPDKWDNQEIVYTDPNPANNGYMLYKVEGSQIINFGLSMEENGWKSFDYNYTIGIYPFLEVKEVQREFLADRGEFLMGEPLYLIVNNKKVILYSEMGMLTSKTAIIFGTDNTIIFHSKTVDRDEGNLNKIDEFKKILSTINLR